MQPWLGETPLRRAFRRVKENHGCAGADALELDRFEAELTARLADLRGAGGNEARRDPRRRGGKAAGVGRTARAAGSGGPGPGAANGGGGAHRAVPRKG